MKKINTFFLVLTPYSHPSKCGIWQRAFSDASILKQNNINVIFYSSNIYKGSKTKLPPNDSILTGDIRRFKSFFSLGENSLFWFPFFSVLKEKSDIIHTHGYRHPHSLQALIAGKLTKRKVFLTSHGPFNKDPRRKSYLKMIDRLYDLLIGWWELKLYDKIIMVAKWEEKELLKRGAPKKNLVYIPNSIDSEYIVKKEEMDNKLKNQVLYMGRVDPVKQPDWIIYLAKKLPSCNFLVRGPLQNYNSFKSKEKNLSIKLGAYDKTDFIQELRKTDIYLFPSKRESFGVTALEAMAAGKVVIANTNLGVKEFINDGKNGFLVNSKEEMKEKIEFVYKNWEKMIEVREKAIETAKNYSNERGSKKLLKLYRGQLSE